MKRLRGRDILTLKKAKSTLTSPVVVVDQASGFGDDDLLTDGIHPNENGERKIAAKWFGALEPFVRSAAAACPL